jgi:hypothetical protein
MFYKKDDNYLAEAYGSLYRPEEKTEWIHKKMGASADYEAAKDPNNHFAHGYISGKRAVMSGKEQVNPHKEGSDAAKEWSAGYDHAKEEAAKA